MVVIRARDWLNTLFSRKVNAMKELLLPIGILVAWYVLNAWVLPRFGVKT